MRTGSSRVSRPLKPGRARVRDDLAGARRAGTWRAMYWNRLSCARSRSRVGEVVEVEALGQQASRARGASSTVSEGSATIISPSTESASGSPLRSRISPRSAGSTTSTEPSAAAIAAYWRGSMPCSCTSRAGEDRQTIAISRKPTRSAERGRAHRPRVLPRRSGARVDRVGPRRTAWPAHRVVLAACDRVGACVTGLRARVRARAGRPLSARSARGRDARSRAGGAGRRARWSPWPGAGGSGRCDGLEPARARHGGRPACR